MPFIIIGIIIALVLIFGGKAIAKKAGALAKKIIKIVVLGYAYMFYMSLVVGWFADTSVFLMLLFCVLPVAVWFIRRKLTFGSRVNKQITNYINFVLNEDTTGKTILLSDFLALDTTKKLMNERKQVDDKPVSQYISQQFDQIFYSTLRSRIQEDKIDQNERIYFYWEYYKFLDYLECCNVELADYIDKVSAVDMSYIYVSGLAFFSSKILDKITESFLPFVESVPELKDAPFSTYTLKNKAYQVGFLDPYIKESTLQAFDDDPDLYKDDFSDLYHNILDFEIGNCIEQKEIVHSTMHTQEDDDDEEYFELNHASPDGIEEYGSEIEAHRIAMEDDEDDLDMLCRIKICFVQALKNQKSQSQIKCGWDFLMAAPYKAVRLGKCIPLLQLFPIGVDDRVLIRVVKEKPIEVFFCDHMDMRAVLARISNCNAGKKIDFPVGIRIGTVIVSVDFFLILDLTGDSSDFSAFLFHAQQLEFILRRVSFAAGGEQAEVRFLVVLVILVVLVVLVVLIENPHGCKVFQFIGIHSLAEILGVNRNLFVCRLCRSTVQDVRQFLQVRVRDSSDGLLPPLGKPPDYCRRHI